MCLINYSNQTFNFIPVLRDSIGKIYNLQQCIQYNVHTRLFTVDKVDKSVCQLVLQRQDPIGRRVKPTLPENRWCYPI